MKLKKSVFIVVFLFIFQSFFAQQIHDFVGIVRPQYSESDLKIKKEFKDQRQKEIDKKKKSGEYVEEEEEEEKNDDKKENQGYEEKIVADIFGSGFVYVTKDGTNYVITNHHVVENFKYASIEFIDPETKEKTLYTDLEVIALSNNIDLALLAFPKGKKPFKYGLELYTEFLKDGEHVVSAGFPALGDKPAWQLAKGNISNERIFEKKLIDPDYSYIIQHTAPIDPGNSGGPLLVVDSKAKSGYRVAGVNTWKYMSRSLTAFTIPAVTVQKFLNEYFNKENNEEVLKKLTEEFAQNLGKKTKQAQDFQKYIAQEDMNKMTYKQFENLFKKYANSNYLIYQIQEPAIPLYKRTFLAMNVWNKYKTFESVKDTNIAKVTVKSIEKKNHDSYKVVFETSDGKNVIESTWVTEMNIWVIKEMSYTKGSEKFSNEKKYSIDSDKSVKTQNLIYKLPAMEYTLSYLKPLVTEKDGSDYSGVSFSIALDISYFIFSTSIEWQATDWDSYFLYDIGAGIMLPLYLDPILVEPYAQVNLNTCLICDEPVGGFSWTGGLKLIWKEQAVGVNVFYKDKYLYPVNRKYDSFHIGSIGIGLLFFWSN
jgi:serine protease Do